MILAANHMSDTHLDVINYDREVVERMAVGSKQYEIFNFRIVTLLRPEDEILKVCFSRRRNLQAYGKRFARRGAFVRIFLRQVTERIVAMIRARGRLRARAFG